MEDAEKVVEETAYQMGVSLATVRSLFALCDRLTAEHGGTWRDHYGAAVVDALRNGELWAKELLLAQLEPGMGALTDTVELAERVGGDAALALHHTTGLPQETTDWFVDLFHQARSR
ncbi:hypothetical protein [Streptomyces sp. NBC_00268]|uniref:hypothetical protein n=1 Tax=Streptomyces sp. NBC_00268 TaxID=2975695 RepID=UPI002257B0B9|nr:hypothetical protein [Streptomyces sp. NBC_00268]MCX5182636.1 hypothetical protein [Streptomyces sp. NBC_00268]